MRLIFGLIGLAFLTACEPQYVIPNSHSGRYYGIDSVFRNQYALQIEDTLVNPIYLDVYYLGEGLYDVSNANGYWVRDGLLTQEKIAIDISDFKGYIYFFQDSLYLTADSETDLMEVTHKASLSR